MEQQVYSNTYGLRLVQHDEQQQQSQQQQQNFIMASSDESQQIVYSPIKPNEIQQAQAQHQTQYISQDDTISNQYLIQQSGQQVFYTTNIPNQNANRIVQQAVQLNHNLLPQQNQQKQIVLQPQQKVVVQRSQDMISNNPNMTNMVDQQNQQTIQYNFQQQSIDQNHQIIIHHQPQTNQIKQTIYPQQTGQIITPPQYIQLQQIQPQNTIVQPGTKIIMPNNANQIRYSIVQKQQPQQIQQIQNQGQLMQIQSAPTPDQSPHNVKFRPRTFTPMKITRTISPQMHVQQQQQPRPRTPRFQHRLVRPIAQSPQQQQQQQQQLNSPQTRVVQAANIGNRLTQAVNSNGHGQQLILVQQQDGQSYILTQPVNIQQNQNQVASPHQIVRTIVTKRPENSPSQVINNQNFHQQAQQQQQQIQENPQQQQNVNQPNEDIAPTTSTLPKKDGDCDDLEDSITATAIAKGTTTTTAVGGGPSTNNALSSNEDLRRRSLGQQQQQAQTPRIGVVRPIQRSSSLQIIRQRTPQRQQPQYQPGLQHELSNVLERESAKMLVILDNGEQRLITFTLPKETCTVQELLDQVGIEIGADSNIECIENPGSEIDYIVKVGNFASRDTTAMTKAAENHIRQQQQAQQQQQRLVQTPQRNVQQQQQQQQPPQQQQQVNESPKSPELAKLPPPKYVEGFYAVCAACGFSGSDHAKCERCHRIFTEDVKVVRMPPQLSGKQISLIAGTAQGKMTITKTINLERKDQIEAIQKKHQIATAEAHRKHIAIGRGRGLLPTLPNMNVSGSGRGRGSRGPKKPIHTEIVTLSSDDEADSDKSHNSNDKKFENVTPKKHFEPEIEDDVVADDFVRQNVDEFNEGEDKIQTSISCRTIRIGSYKFDSKEPVCITSKGIRIVAPSVKNAKDITVLNIQHSEVIKFVLHFSKQLAIIFIYTKPSCGRYVVDQLSMSQVTDKSPYFAPLSRNETQRKIILLTDHADEVKNTLKSIYKVPTFEEICNRDANELLVRSTGIPLTGSASSAQQNTSLSGDAANKTQDNLKNLLIYPRGRGGITITAYDYLCLGSDNYLNDVIIDFYLKYVHSEMLTEEQRNKTHIFSQFFYKRLTTMSKDQRSLTAAQKRHQRVQSWTKNVNLFEKDFVIVPINEQSHWFLAIICFPNLTEPHTMDTNQPIKLAPPIQKKGKKGAALQIGNTTITPLTKKEESIEVHDDQGSERDEAEGDESELGSNIESDEEEVVDRGQPVKVPCILIFDSLGGTSRARVVATLRDYLTCEYKAKYPATTLRQYTKLNMFANVVKVPQQQNFTDCGLFLLQYVEQFFADPIKDFRIPLKSMLNWFHQDIVTRKREDIANLIKTLIKREGFEDVELPAIEFPTKDGVILEQPENQLNSLGIDENFEDPGCAPTGEETKEVNQLEEKPKKVYVAKRKLEKTDNGNGENSNAKSAKLNKNKS